eukprot:5027068-Amphidinium_carterae.1
MLTRMVHCAPVDDCKVLVANMTHIRSHFGSRLPEEWERAEVKDPTLEDPGLKGLGSASAIFPLEVDGTSLFGRLVSTWVSMELLSILRGPRNLPISMTPSMRRAAS